MFTRTPLSFLILSLSCAAIAGGFVEPAPVERAVKSPLLSLSYAHKSADLSDLSGSDSALPLVDQFDGYELRFSMPVVGCWGLDLSYFSSQAVSVYDPSEDEEASNALQSIGMAVSYDLPFTWSENLDMSAKFIVEENLTSIANAGIWQNAAPGVGLTGAYRFSDKMGLQVGLAYTVPQGVVTLYDSLFTWHASLAYYLS